MAYTKNYPMPQWGNQDRIMMDDFNQMCADMDAGLTTTAQQAAQAKQEAAQARQEAAILPYAVGTYIGNGTEQEIYLGFRPSFLHICGMNEDGSGVTISSHAVHWATSGHNVTIHIQFTDTGFKVVSQGPQFPRPNELTQRYDYIAFR